MTWILSSKLVNKRSKASYPSFRPHSQFFLPSRGSKPTCFSPSISSTKMVSTGGGPQRGTAAAAASLRRRRTTSSGATAGGSGTMLQFYTDDAPGLKISPNVVLIMSIGFIAFVAVLHVAGKLYFVR
ncbi:hypothetical protein QQ045_008397 [Rhodiola kirilowii]